MADDPKPAGEPTLTSTAAPPDPSLAATPAPADPGTILTPGQTASAAVAAGKTPGEPEPPKPAADAPKPTVEVAALKLPEGFKADDPALTQFATIANEAKISQDVAQKLVDFHAAALKKASEASSEYWGNLQKEWGESNKTEFGPEPAKSPKIIAVSKLIDSLGEKPASAFREALDMSGMGNHPAIVKAMVLLAERLTEPAHARGAPPAQRPATAAEAIYGPPKTGT